VSLNAGRDRHRRRLDAPTRIGQAFRIDAGGPRLFVFDLDGTLANFVIDWDDVKARIGTLLGFRGPLTPLLPSIDALSLDLERKQHVYELIDDIELSVATTFVRSKILEDLFRRLTHLEANVALVTMQGRKPAIEALRRLGILKFVDLIVSRDDHISRKRQIEECVLTFQVSPSNTVVIADRPEDMAAAREVGCRTIAIGVRPGLIADLKAASAGDLLEILNLEGS
jgi:phosphoglycolate phosphatase-like HAD superfamily hydrolase